MCVRVCSDLHLPVRRYRMQQQPGRCTAALPGTDRAQGAVPDSIVAGHAWGCAAQIATPLPRPWCHADQLQQHRGLQHRHEPHPPLVWAGLRLAWWRPAGVQVGGVPACGCPASPGSHALGGAAGCSSCPVMPACPPTPACSCCCSDGGASPEGLRQLRATYQINVCMAPPAPPPSPPPPSPPPIVFEYVYY